MACFAIRCLVQWLSLLLFAALPSASAWTLGAAGQTCDAVCTAAGKTCTVEKMRMISSEYLMNWVLDSFSLTKCDFDYTPDLPFVTSEPLQMLLYTADDFYIGRACLSDGSLSECSASESHSERLCCCVGAGEDMDVVCEVPTSTTTTRTETTSTSSTRTTTSETQTTSTSSTFSATTTVTFSSTTSTSSLTSTSQTTTSVTATTQTETTTSFLTTTSTVTTQTTTSETVTTQTTTSATVTTTTMTTTTGMTAVLQFAVSAGDTVLIVDSNAGFSIGDIIRISRPTQPRFYEFVEITAFGTVTISSRRLATYSTWTISPPLENAYGPGAAIQNYGPASSFTGGDPVTYFGGQKWKFWLPLRQELLLLATPDLRLYGRVFPGPEIDQQWFDYFMVALPDDTPIATVRVKPHSNRTLAASRRCGSKRFEMLDIFLGSGGRPLKEMRKMEYTAKSIRFEINCRNQAARTEYLYFETPSIVFVITSSHAGVDFRDDPLMAFKYMHLDFLVMEALRPQTYSGILPEVWEVRPRSAEVDAMLIPPVEPKLQVCPEVGPFEEQGPGPVNQSRMLYIVIIAGLHDATDLGCRCFRHGFNFEKKAQYSPALTKADGFGIAGTAPLQKA